MIERQQAEEEKRTFRAAAFVGWQIAAIHGAKMSFSEHLRAVGLGEKAAKLTAEERKEMARRAIEKAERIKAMDKLHPRNK